LSWAAGLAGLFLLLLFAGVQAGPTADEPLDHELWLAIEIAYHEGDRARLLTLGNRVLADRQAEFERILAAFDGRDASIPPSPARIAQTDVGINGAPCSYPSIGDAISAASDGDTIYIPSGHTFYETLGIIGKDLSFVASLADCSAPDPGATSTSVTIDAGGGSGATWGGLATVGMSKTVTFTHIYLTNGQALYGGNLYVDPGGRLVLDESEVANGAAANYGGGVRVYFDAALEMINGSLIHANEATGTTGGGGGVAVYQGVMTMTDESSIGLGGAGANTSADRGGGIILESSTLYMDRSKLLFNSAVNEGGGLYVSGISDVELHNTSRIGSIFAGFTNTANYGGGVYVTGLGGIALYDNSRIARNSATSYGGGVYVTNGGYAALQSAAQLLSNTAGIYGGGAYVVGDGSRLNLIYGGGQIRGNNAGSRGGGIYVSQAAAVYGDNTEILNNTSGLYGGGIYIAQFGYPTATDVILVNGTLVAGNRSDYGGGIYLRENGSQLIISASRVEDNHVTDSGGGIRMAADVSVDVSGGSVISGNTAAYGGGLAIFDGTADLIGSRFEANHAATQGGGIYQNGGVIHATDVDIRSNTSDVDGGGIYTLLSPITLESVRVIGNQAGEDGGGIAAVNSSRLTMRAPLCSPFALPFNRYCSEVRENVATGWGAGIYLYDAGTTVTIQDTAFISNTGLTAGSSPGTAILVGDSASAVVTNTLFSGQNNTVVHVYTGGRHNSHSSTYAGNVGRPLYVVAAGVVTLTNNVMWDNAQPAFYQPGATVSSACNDTQTSLGGPGDISANPLFVTLPGRGPYHLGAGSPAVDACSSGPGRDLDGIARPRDGDGVSTAQEFDMGAFERLPGGVIYLPVVLRNSS
jgi:predicted outer membrane repeat protein